VRYGQVCGLSIVTCKGDRAAALTYAVDAIRAGSAFADVDRSARTVANRVDALEFRLQAGELPVDEGPKLNASRESSSTL
jgi:hypothetical protein